jgi:hypothetical protein
MQSRIGPVRKLGRHATCPIDLGKNRLAMNAFGGLGDHFD